MQWAFFDVDGTVISKDSFLHLLKTTLKKEPLRILLLKPALFCLFLMIFFPLDKRWIKSALLWACTFGKGRKGSVRFLQKLGQDVGQFWFVEADDVLSNFKKQGVSICFVSASGQTWLRSLLRAKLTNADFSASGYKVIGSRLGFFCWGVVLKSPNCYQSEKLIRIKEFLNLTAWDFAYSDHVADLPLLKNAKQKFVIAPKEKHLAIFEKELGEFQLLRWKN